MTLTEIGILLHYYWSPLEHPSCGDEAYGWRACINNLKAEGLLEDDLSSDRGRSYRTTEKAAVYIEAIRDVSLPVSESRWVIPGKSA